MFQIQEVFQLDNVFRSLWEHRIWPIWGKARWKISYHKWIWSELTLSRLILLRKQLNSWGFTFFVSEEEGIFQSIEKERTDMKMSVLTVNEFLIVELNSDQIIGWSFAVNVKVVRKVRLKRGVGWAKRILFAHLNLHFPLFAVLALHFFQFPNYYYN